MYSDLNDVELLDLIKANDEKAFTEVFSRYWKKLFAISYSRLHSRQIAEDVVQEVLSGLWQRRHLHIDSLNAYLAAATRYATIRQLSRQSSHLLIEDLPEVVTISHNADVHLRFLEKMVHEEINLLPEKCRLVFLYSRQSGLSNKEISGELHISEKAVEKHITKAIRMLRARLKHILPLLTSLI
jgi:RNA polymerase sigma-70 factor (ECF subfamily)